MLSQNQGRQGQSDYDKSKKKAFSSLPSHTKPAHMQPFAELRLLPDSQTSCLAGVMPWHGLNSLCCNAVYTYKHSKLQ